VRSVSRRKRRRKGGEVAGPLSEEKRRKSTFALVGLRKIVDEKTVKNAEQRGFRRDGLHSEGR